MKFSLKTFSLLGLAAMAALVLAADGTVLKLAPKEGSIKKYKLSASFEAGGQTATVSGDVTSKTMKIDATTGDVTIERSQGTLTVDLGGQTIPVDAGPPVVEVFHADGSLAELRGESLNPGTYRLETLSMIKFPKDPLTVGTAWKVEVPTDAKTGVVKATGNYKVLALEKVGSIDTFKLSSSIKETEGDVPASSEGTVWINAEDGTVVKYEGAWTNAPVAPAPMPVSGKYTLTQVQ